ncbi:MAG: response regulator transcription factor [Bacteroidales bacterium]|nr:response regulator transcription factor [Bacteroidales bacterium]
MANNPKIQVAIIDDHQLFRNGLKFIIENEDDMEVVIEASNGRQFLDFLKNLTPHVALMDINMPDMDGVITTKRALEICPDLHVLVLSMYSDVEYYNTMIDLGVKGFILKDIDNNELTDAIRKVHAGGNYFSQELLLKLIKNKPGEGVIDLTPREKEVLELICKGYSNLQISEELFISQRTVERHRSSLLFKTDSKNSISLVVFAIKNNLVKI